MDLKSMLPYFYKKENSNIQKILDAVTQVYTNMKDTRTEMEKLTDMNSDLYSSNMLDLLATDYGVTRDVGETDAEVKNKIKILQALRLTNCTLPDVYSMIELVYGDAVDSIVLTEGEANINIDNHSSISDTELNAFIKSIIGSGISINLIADRTFRFSTLDIPEYGSLQGFDNGKFAEEV